MRISDWSSDVCSSDLDRLANTHLQWEKTASFHIGFDLGFLNDRITTTLDYFQMSMTDMIMNHSLPGFSGFTSITNNLGEVQKQGMERSINTLSERHRSGEGWCKKSKIGG